MLTILVSKTPQHIYLQNLCCATKKSNDRHNLKCNLLLDFEKRYKYICLLKSSSYKNTEISPSTMSILSYYITQGKYHTSSNIWIRLLPNSDTTILPSLRFAVDIGQFNSPFPLPSVPNFVTNLPLSSNT